MANDRFFDRLQDQFGRGDMDRGSRSMRDDDRSWDRDSQRDWGRDLNRDSRRDFSRDDSRDFNRDSYRDGSRSSYMDREPMNENRGSYSSQDWSRSFGIDGGGQLGARDWGQMSNMTGSMGNQGTGATRNSFNDMSNRSAYNDFMRGGSYNERQGLRGGYGSDSGYSSGFGLGSGSSFGSRTSSFDSRSQGVTRAGEFAGRGPKGYQRSDDRIREDICETLMRHPEVDASEIEIDVKQGEVWLRGHVNERRQKRLAEDLIESLSGVRDVHNEIRVQKSDGLMARMADAIGLGDDEQTKSSMKSGKSTPSNSARN